MTLPTDLSGKAPEPGLRSAPSHVDVLSLAMQPKCQVQEAPLVGKQECLGRRVDLEDLVCVFGSLLCHLRSLHHHHFTGPSRPANMSDPRPPLEPPLASRR